MSLPSCENECALCEFFDTTKLRRYYETNLEFVIVESPATYAPVLISAHGVLKPVVAWFLAVKAIANKLYAQDYTLQGRRSGDHFVIEVTPVVRTRDLLFKP